MHEARRLILYYILYNIYYILYTAYYILYTIYYVVYTISYLLHILHTLFGRLIPERHAGVRGLGLRHLEVLRGRQEDRTVTGTETCHTMPYIDWTGLHRTGPG